MSETMEFDTRGVPIVDMPTKLKYLEHCLSEGCYEDAAGHVCDLLGYVSEKLQSNMPERTWTPLDVLAYYGNCPTPIKSNAGK